ncbi:natural cytotoxicity triggering receptor 2-like [Arvicola amphibius]|uniref:natural cytotoxicity triggering receptor 2-like n=1 Tax=Arvicola amphibius TaxID=1047088 RepID=UPI001C08CE56|nr:natural cytotoxicity triggering receptor 2-like [Arvicola amphibius]
MAWEATYLLSPILLVLLASGSWAQDAELLPTVEGQTIFVKCQYNSNQHSKEKIWCQQTPTESCKLLVSSLNTGTQWPKFFIQEYPKSHFFTVTMTMLAVRDSGLYYCGIHDNHKAIAVLRRFLLVVSKVYHESSQGLCKEVLSLPAVMWITERNSQGLSAHRCANNRVQKDAIISAGKTRWQVQEAGWSHCLCTQEADKEHRWDPTVQPPNLTPVTQVL